jgi:streptogramin lyase
MGGVERVKRRRPLHVEAFEQRRLMAVTVSEYPLPSPNSDPTSITTGPDGNLWFVENEVGGGVGEINPTTHAIAVFPIPTANSTPAAISAGPDGNLWFTDEVSGKIGEVNATTHAVSEFPVPYSLVPLAITAGPDGNLWFTTWNGVIGTINPTTHSIDIIPIPATSSIFGIAVGPDGNLWFTAETADIVGMVNPTTHAVAEFPLPPEFSPDDITAGPDGNLWFTGIGNTVLNGDVPGQIGMINPTTHAITVFRIPTGWPSTGITMGPDGDIDFLDFNPGGAPSGSIGTINPTTHAITEMLLGADDTEDTNLEGITSGPDGQLWSTLANAIEEIQITPSVTLSPQPTGASDYGVTKKGVEAVWIGFNTAVAATWPGEPDPYSVFAAVKKRGKMRIGRELSVTDDQDDVGAASVIIPLSRPHQGAIEVVVSAGVLALDGLTSTSTFTEIVKR